MPFSAEYLLEKAEETRSVGEVMHNPAARRQMFEIAAQYAEMAARARACGVMADQPGDGRYAVGRSTAPP